MLADFTIQFIQRLADLLKHLMPARRETVDTRRLGPLRLRRAEPAAVRHAGQYRIQRPRTEAIAVVVQFFEHPLTVDPLFGGMVEDVNLPEAEKELTDDGI